MCNGLNINRDIYKTGSIYHVACSAVELNLLNKIIENIRLNLVSLLLRELALNRTRARKMFCCEDVWPAYRTHNQGYNKMSNDSLKLHFRR